jgi:hypothetical protein
VYEAAPAAAKQGGQTVSIDEMTGIQALERAAKSLPMKPGHVERREFEYVRHGTKALIAAFDVATGKVRGSIGETRTEADFVAFLEALFASAPPTAPWDIICDNLNTHMSEGVTRLGRPALRHRRRSRGEGQIRHSSVDGDTRGVPARCLSPNYLPLQAQACFAHQPDRDPVLNPGR